MANNTATRKAKGRKLQKKVVAILRDFTGLDKYSNDHYDGDIQSKMMGGGGIDVLLSPAAMKLVPFDIECKCQEKLNIWDSIKQCEINTRENRIPLLIFQRNRTETYCTTKFSDLLKLMKNG